MKNEDESLVLKLFGKPDLGYVPKSQLVRAVAIQHRHIDKLRLDLFCSNPDHQMFHGVDESVLAPMRVERLRRISA